MESDIRNARPSTLHGSIAPFSKREPVVAFFLLLLFQSDNHTIDGSIAFFFAHSCQPLQGVLQLNGIGIGHKRLEHLLSFRESTIVFPVFVQQSDGHIIASLGIAKAVSLPIQVTELQQQDTFLDAVACGPLVALLICADGTKRIPLRQIDVADGIVDLVKILLVIIRRSHAFQLGNHLLLFSSGHHFGHGHTGVERKRIIRVQFCHVLIGLIGLSVPTGFSKQLPQQKPLACLLLAPHLMTDDLLQIRNSLLIVARVYIIIRIRVVPFLLCAPIDRVAAHVADNVLGLVLPTRLDIALGQPCLRPMINGGLGSIEATHIRKGGDSLLEVALMEL